MANLYGVANAPGLPSVFATLGGDVPCPNDVFTVIATTPALVAPSAGYFYAWVQMGLVITNGASIPSGLTYGIAIGAGSYSNNISLGAYGLTASGSNYLPFSSFSAPSQSAWQGAGSTVRVGFQPGTNACTIRGLSWLTVVLLRAPDQ